MLGPPNQSIFPQARLTGLYGRSLGSYCACLPLYWLSLPSVICWSRLVVPWGVCEAAASWWSRQAQAPQLVMLNNVWSLCSLPLLKCSYLHFSKVTDTETSTFQRSLLPAVSKKTGASCPAGPRGEVAGPVRRQEWGEGMGTRLCCGFCGRNGWGEVSISALASLTNFSRFWAIRMDSSCPISGPGLT